MSVLDEDEEEKPIWHFLYPSWPDFGALDENNVASIISLMELSRQKNGRQENARIVHCSAGVGRTGTFVALEFLVGELHGGAWEGWKGDGDPVYETVDQLRQQRRTMVQSFEQFKFLYEVLRKMWEEKYHTPCVGGDHDRKADSTIHDGEHSKTLVYENGTAIVQDCADTSVDGDKDDATPEQALCRRYIQ
jgi:protein-tyrosine phosphatase